MLPVGAALAPVDKGFLLFACKQAPAKHPRLPFFQRHSGSVQERLPILILTKKGHEGIEVIH
jgi:hypothetical protein